MDYIKSRSQKVHFCPKQIFFHKTNIWGRFCIFFGLAWIFRKKLKGLSLSVYLYVPLNENLPPSR